MASIQEELVKFIESDLLTEDIFLVEVNVNEFKTGRSKVLVLLDGDKGITADICANISRKLGDFIEGKDFFQDPYLLEVSSPGIDFPLKLKRQYVKNIGRNVKVELEDGTSKIGKLQAVNEEGIELLLPIKKKKKEGDEDPLVKILFADIKKTVVQISFK